ncbi:MAG: hypothetical protein J5I90_15275 [Caldilineales bacterium]|nr:hypothetical protein [Caldilineales bacterium]
MNLHGVPIELESEDERIIRRWQRQWSSFPQGRTDPGASPILLRLRVASETPASPPAPVVAQRPGLTYFLAGRRFTAHFERWGRYDIDLDDGVADGVMTEIGLKTYGVFEDMIIISLAPLLRRRGLFTIHAFTAARDDHAVVIVGDIGAGKTTTGINLLCHGYQLVSNDSPLLAPISQNAIELRAYPGLLSAYPDSISWFPQLASIAHPNAHPSAKISFAADEIWPEPWREAAKPGLLLFPKIVHDLERPRLAPMPSITALQRLVGLSIENWDSETMPGHLSALRALAANAPAFELHLAPDIERIPELIDGALQEALSHTHVD